MYHTSPSLLKKIDAKCYDEIRKGGTMDVKKETVFSLAGENPVMEGCTISSLLSKGEDHFVFCFSLAKDTGISGEIYAAPACTMFSRDV